MEYVCTLLLSTALIYLSAVHLAVNGAAETGPPTENDNPIVAYPHGRVKGKRDVVENVLVDVFMGLPFATAARWAPPSPLSAPVWDGERDATQAREICPQVHREAIERSLRKRGMMMPVSEDCLFLNVYTPSAKRQSGERLPVMVWIHGGSFVHGAGAFYESSALAAVGGVVVVTINYRLGVLGFLQLAKGRTANFGLLDQLAALQWVKENIKYFGGDESQVTIFGESAGGALVGWLLLTAQTPGGLFKRAILQSGTPNADWAWRSSERAVLDTRRLAEILKCDVSEQAVMETCLKEKDAASVLEAQFKLVDRTNWTFEPPLELLWASPIVDGHTIVADPWTILRSDKPLPAEQVMVGFMKDEMTYFHTRSPAMAQKAARGYNRTEFDRFIAERILLSGPNPVVSGSDSLKWHLSKSALTTLRKVTELEFTGMLDLYDPEELRDHMFTVWTDAMFGCASVSFLQLAAKKNTQLFAYYFTHADRQFPKWAKATHTVELAYLFGSPILDRPVSIYGPTSGESAEFTDDEKSLSRAVIDFWSSFVKTG